MLSILTCICYHLLPVSTLAITFPEGIFLEINNFPKIYRETQNKENVFDPWGKLEDSDFNFFFQASFSNQDSRILTEKEVSQSIELNKEIINTILYSWWASHSNKSICKTESLEKINKTEFGTSGHPYEIWMSKVDSYFRAYEKIIFRSVLHHNKNLKL